MIFEVFQWYLIHVTWVQNRLPIDITASLINRKWSNRWLTDRKCSTYSIILIECSVSCCQSKYSSDSDKHSVVIKKIKKIIITFYVFINLQFLINRFHRDGESAVTHFLISQWKLSAIWFVQRILTIETTSRLLSKMILVGLDLWRGHLRSLSHIYTNSERLLPSWTIFVTCPVS